MIALLAGYLFEESVHLTSYHERSGDVASELWTACRAGAIAIGRCTSWAASTDITPFGFFRVLTKPA